MDMQRILRAISIFVICFVLVGGLFVLYRYLDTKSHEQVVDQPSSLPAQEHSLNQSFEQKRESASRAETETTSRITIANEPEQETEPRVGIDPTSNYSGRITFLAQQRRVNSETFFTREDLPEDIRQEFDLMMERYKRLGYFSAEESFIEKMNTPYNEVEAFELNDPALRVTADELDDTLLADLVYVGVIPDRISEQEGSPVPGIRRVFENEAGYISLYEGDLRNSDALLQKELVNKSINGYPATQISYCAPSMRCVSQLSWLTNDKRYDLTLSGDVTALGEDELVEIASSLDLPPPPQSIVSE
jgi:hypothetical protein